jgi:hypothetical protein
MNGTGRERRESLGEFLVISPMRGDVTLFMEREVSVDPLVSTVQGTNIPGINISA